MTSPRLPNYLRAHRKRHGLSQEDVSKLLGAEGGAKVCRYEKFQRKPTLETALACEVVFRKPVRELFAGLYQNIERRVAIRASKLLRTTEGRKAKALGHLTPPSTKNPPKKQ